MNRLIGLALFLASFLCVGEARAQTVVTICVQSTPGPSCTPVTTVNPLPVNASVSVSPFGGTQTTGTPITATTAGVAGTLPAGTVVVATNVGTTNAAYCKLGAAATTSDQYIAPNGGWFAFAVGAATQLTCATPTSTTTVNMVGGAGLPAGTGGGGGGGSGGSVTQGTSPWVVAGGGTAGTAAAGVVTVQGIASMTPFAVTGTFFQATQPVSAASLPLPTGAATEATLLTINTNIQAGAALTGAAVPPSAIYMGVNVGGNLTGFAPGTAGTASTQVLSMQGVASMVPLSTSPAISTLTTGITRPADTTAYAANDNFSNSTSAPTAGGFTFTSACRASGGSGLIKDAVISASAGTSYQGEVWIFDQAVTAVNDNAAFTVSDSDVLNLVGVIPFTTSDVTAVNAISYVTQLDIGYTCVGTANLRYLVKIMNAPTPASAEVLTVRIKVQN